MRQIDIFGGEHEPERESAPAGEPLELFDVAAFSHRVPGTLPMIGGELRAVLLERFGACPFCESGEPACCEVREENGAGVLEVLRCCETCEAGP